MIGLAVFLYAMTSILIYGLVLKVLWGWFLIPLGLPTLSLVSTIGVALVVQFLTHQYLCPSKKQTLKMLLYERIVVDISIVAPTLCIGWILHLLA